MAHQLHQKHAASEKGYSWMFFYGSRALLVRILVTLLIIGAGGLFYMWYCQFGNDIAPDSMVGFGYAIAGTICFILAATLYTLRRRSHKRTTGQLNAALNWHSFFAVLGLAFVLMHSFGNFNARTGTYALYGLIALIVNGFTGRVLDRLLPLLMAAEVSRMLTWQGEDRLEVILHNLPASPSWPPISSMPSVESWDMAYVSLEAASPHTKHQPLWEQESTSQIRAIQRAMFREQVYRYIICYWRMLHIALALLTIGLIIWHLVYVAQLLLPTFFHRA